MLLQGIFMGLFLSKEEQLSTKPFFLVGSVNTSDEDLFKILTFTQVGNSKCFYLFNKIKIWQNFVKN